MLSVSVQHQHCINLPVLEKMPAPHDQCRGLSLTACQFQHPGSCFSGAFGRLIVTAIRHDQPVAEMFAPSSDNLVNAGFLVVRGNQSGYLSDSP
jgi:hypothetical protein